MTYDEALAWLYGAQLFGIRLGLDCMRELLAALGWEPGATRFIHVAGTNGKGSVCAIADALCRAAGLRTGLYTSPHLVTFRERIRIQGAMAAPGEIAAGLTRIRETCGRIGAQPTFFELATALALDHFRRAGVDVAVLETGLGGRLDATNVVRPAVSVIVSIGLDHTSILGETIEQIAREKAGILKPGIPAVSGPLPDPAAREIAAAAARCGAPLLTVSEPTTLPVSLRGSHQRLNAAIALRALQAAGIAISDEAARRGLSNIEWPGRFQDTGRGFILDGAHNPDAARRLAETWTGEFGANPARIILGIVRDKDATGICAALAPIAAEFLLVPVPGPRGGPAEELAPVASRWRPCRVFPSLEAAIAAVSADPPGPAPILITGSFFLIGHALAALGLAEPTHEVSAQ